MASVVLTLLFAAPDVVCAQRSLVAALDAPAPERAPRRGPGAGRFLLIGGAAALGGGYVFNVGAGLFAGINVDFCIRWFASSTCPDTPDDDRWGEFRALSAIPVVGPWLQLAAMPEPFDRDNWGPYVLAMGLIQAAGVGLLIAGLIVELEEAAADEDEVFVIPRVSANELGVALAGSF